MNWKSMHMWWTVIAILTALSMAFSVSKIGVFTLIFKWMEICSSSRVSYNLPKFCPNATWHTSGETFKIPAAEKPNRFRSTSIFVDTKNGIHICCVKTKHGWTIMWYNSLAKVLGNSDSYKNVPNSIFIVTNDHTYIDGKNKIIIYYYRWSQQRWNNYIGLNGNKLCFGLFVDIEDTIYCSLKDDHQVIKKLVTQKGNKWQIAAGTGYSGNKSNMLSEPRGIFVNVNFNLYVADCKNNRIQLFTSAETNGETIVNSTVPIDKHSLSDPTAVILDADSNLYIVDSGNHRIVFVASSLNKYKCLAGCSGQSGKDDASLDNPTSISFDRLGNIFVSDTNNFRVQKFALETKHCVETSTQDMPVTDDLSSVTFSNDNDNNDYYNDDYEYTDPMDSNDVDSATPQESATVSIPTADGNRASEAIFSSEPSISSSPSPPIDKPSPIHFVPPNCSNSSSIGSFCNISTQPCDIQTPCQNSGDCTNDPTHPQGYSCTCKSGFNGTNCEVDIRPCQPNICLNDGTCIEVNSTHFFCNCIEGRTGIHCDILIDYCHNVTCLNKGVCRPLILDYKCECVTSSFSGRHCEHVTTSLIIRQYVSKTFGYIAIIAVSTVIGFVVIMDILKYVFGIDPVREERDQIRRGRLLLQRKDYETRKPKKTFR